MDYFRLLNFAREPFSNTPDPDFFYPSREHVGCLQKLELSIRLRRGLNVVIGHIGTGKSTLSRQLIRKCTAGNNLETHLILDPHFASPMEFLSTLADMFGVSVEGAESEWQIKEGIKNHLFKRGVDEKKTVVLLIDEGQKTPESCLEILRELLNYETNEYKLLQIVIFAQEEFRQTLAEHRNFADRINFYHVLGPLSFSETRRMLQFRLNQAQDSHRTPRIFTPLGLLAVYRATGGYPRKIIHLCHRVLVTMIIQNRTHAGWSVVQWCSKMLFPGEPLRVSWKTASVAAGLLVVFGIAILAAEPFKVPFLSKTAKITALTTPREKAPTLPAPDLSRTAALLNSAEPGPTFASSGPSGMELGAPDDTMDGTSEAAASSAIDQVVVAAPEPAAVSRLLTAEALAKLLAIRSEEPAEAVSAGSSPPEILGQITVRPGDTLEQLIRRVYGFFDQQVLKAVLQVNPQIAERNNLAVGRTITFPLLPVRVGSLPKHACWVQVAEKNSLEDAYQLYRTYPRSAPPISILPYRNGRDGLKFAMLLKDCCIDKQAAAAAIAGLPLPLAGGARVQSKWDEGAFFPGSSELTPSMVD